MNRQSSGFGSETPYHGVHRAFSDFSKKWHRTTLVCAPSIKFTGRDRYCPPETEVDG
jgi:hypothetical protein